jgi:hypothetical protein
MRGPHARPVKPPADESLAELLVGLASIVLVFIVLFVLLPVML